MNDERGKLAVETLLKIVLGLVAVLLALHVLEILVGAIVSLIVKIVTPILLLLVAAVVVLWLLDYL
ncbi:DUF7554 family protein [Halopiger goleimassiliensis]|uniref:DUF7554 family protein n=1 Tax=Halopiger goleimassiliensis TaxID=1293048 RepID=UPI0006775C13|nr:hypothetical protein [Halopiger goleimassiliensis]